MQQTIKSSKNSSVSMSGNVITVVVGKGGQVVGSITKDGVTLAFDIKAKEE